MNIIEKNVNLCDATKVFSVIEKTLIDNRNTQVFVDIKLYAELMQNGRKTNVKETYCYNATYHYAEDRLRWLKYFINEDGKEHAINIASFVHNTTDYVQLVEFLSKEFPRYVHSCEKLEQILIINQT